MHPVLMYTDGWLSARGTIPAISTEYSVDASAVMFSGVQEHTEFDAILIQTLVPA